MPMLRILAALFLAAPTINTAAAQLRGSLASMRLQHRVAVRNDLTFLGTARDVKSFVRKDLLVPVRSSSTVLVDEDVSFAYARPQLRTFIQRLARQYRAATGERLVVTSLTRPRSRQPENASPLSVHPAGIAVDFRIPSRPKSRRWLERALLSLEDKEVLDVTRETHPAHYHVAVFPAAYERHLRKLTRGR